MPKYSEQDLHQALAAIDNGMGKREVARKFMVPKSTLHGQLHDARP
jgi:DNA-binding IclR family transcriptional regulator